MNPVHRALERAAAFFADRQTRAGYVARRLLQAPHPEDERLAQALVKERRARMRSDGSIAGDLMATAWVVWELLEMGQPREHPVVQRATRWLLGRQDKEGAFGLGCSPKRHEMKACEHFIGGFFAYRSAGRTIKRLALPTGANATSGMGARFLASCFALRSVLRAGQDQNTLVRRHAGSLLALPQAREAVALAAPKLAKQQTLKGTVGAGTYAEERTLVAVRAWLIAREYA